MRLPSVLKWALGISGWILFAITLAGRWAANHVEETQISRPREVPRQKVGSFVDALPQEKKTKTALRKQRNTAIEAPAQNSLQSVFQKADAFIKTQEWDKALELLLEALNSHPESEQLQARIGNLYFQKDPQAAIPYFENSLMSNPNQPEVLPKLVAAYQHPDQRKRGQEFLQEFADRHPNSVTPVLAYVDFLAAGGKPRAAADYAEEKAQQLSQPADAMQARGLAGNLYLGAGQPEKAIQNFEVVARHEERIKREKQARGESTYMEDKRLAELRMGQAYAFARLGNFEQARKMADQLPPTERNLVLADLNRLSQQRN